MTKAKDNPPSPKRRRRAHNTDGTFTANNPDTQVNEAYEAIELPVTKEENDYSVKQKVDGMSTADAGKYSSQPKVRPAFGNAKTIQH